MGVAVRLAWNRAAQPVPGGSRGERRCFIGAGCAGLGTNNIVPDYVYEHWLQYSHEYSTPPRTPTTVTATE
eukprot:1390844-Prymnesium_polylepis.1